MALPRAPSFRLEGRRALAPGAGRGIGRAVAAALAEAGAEVVLAARSGAEVETVAEAIRARGEKVEALALALALALDVTDTAAVACEVAARGPFKVLVNNAGTNRPAELTALTEADYDAVTDLNVRAAIFACKAVAKGLLEAGLPAYPGLFIRVPDLVGGDGLNCGCGV